MRARLFERPEWKFFAVLPKVHRALAIFWWATLIARGVLPAIFAIATGAKTGDANVGTIGELAAEVMADAIVRAVRQATGVPGYPAIRDLK